MLDPRRQFAVLSFMNGQLLQLQTIVTMAKADGNYDVAKERLGRWKFRTVKYLNEQVSQIDGEKLRKLKLDAYSYLSNFSDVSEEADVYRNFLIPLSEEIERHPEYLTESDRGASANPQPSTETVDSQADFETSDQSQTVFLVHGHDDANLLRLEKLLKEQCGLNPIILKYQPGQGRTLIEKFEQEATKAGFAFVLLTPDDLVENPDGTYAQSRPNVVFELAWFYGRLGRKNVCILCKRGTAIHSDLAGINRIEFTDSIDEAFLQIESELKAGGLI